MEISSLHESLFILNDKLAHVLKDHKVVEQNGKVCEPGCRGWGFNGYL